HPGFDRVDVAVDLLDGEHTAPAVVAEWLHRGFEPRVLFSAAVFEDGAEQIMAVGENIRFDRDCLADHAFDGEASAVDLRLDVFDDDALPPVPWKPRHVL